MPFEIDTGMVGSTIGKIGYCEAMLDAALDAAPDNADPLEQGAALARLIVLDLVKPKTAETVRMHALRYWPLIAPMSRTAPASFDFIIEQLAERLGELS